MPDAFNRAYLERVWRTLGALANFARELFKAVRPLTTTSVSESLELSSIHGTARGTKNLLRGRMRSASRKQY